MNRLHALFLEALNASLHGKTVDWADEFPVGEWTELFRLTRLHSVLPLVYEAVYPCPAAQAADPAVWQPFKTQAIQTAVLQTQKTRSFLQLEQALQAAGITPLVVKGLICRNLYPQPDLRPSGDEDLLIPAEQFPACHAALLAQGMQPLEPEQDLAQAHEVPYGKPGSPLRIELHKQLFPPNADAYGSFNRFFDGVFDRAVSETIQGVPVLTMGCTDHLFYLICHAFKHFLHSGFGIRQVCDIILFANAHGNEIDWPVIQAHCREIRADRFAVALFRIGEAYLSFDPDRACYPEDWHQLPVDETALLEDLLAGGIYGASDLSRRHSAGITLHAAAGGGAGNPVLRTAFPSARTLAPRYPYLNQSPFLLPAAWLHRLLRYGGELHSNSGSRVSEAVQIGTRRVELLKQYGIIDE